MLLRTVKLLLVFSLFLSIGSAYAHKGLTREQYIALHKDDAIRDMNKTGVPASITLAQALLESEDGNSTLALEANNHFGIKCTSDWTGDYFTKDDDKKDECFRKYKSVLESYDDHSYFLKTRPRYAFLFEIKKTDYKQWAKGLKKSGYATNPKYADELIKIIEDFQLYKLDSDKEDTLMASASGSSAPQKSYSNNRQAESASPVVTSTNAAPLPLLDKPAASPHHTTRESNTVDPFSEYRTVMSNNGVPCIIAKKGDTYDRIAKEYEMMPWLIYKYNDASKGDAITEGQVIYIKPKARTCRANEDFYIAKEGDTLHSISQQFGIKMKMLYKRNDMEKGMDVRAGQKVWLNKGKS